MKSAQLNTMIKRFTLIFVCLIFISSCTTKVAYNFLDWAMMWYFESYVSLNKEQKKYTKKQLDDFHHWHRTTQLPRYALYLEGLKIRLNSDQLNAEMIHKETDELQLFLDDSLNYLTPLFAQLLASFSDQQVEELLASIADDRDEYQQEFVDVSEKELHKARIKELKSNLSLASIGSYSKQQNNTLKNWSHSLTPFEQLALEQQEIWAEELTLALAERQDRVKLEATLKKLLFVHTDHWAEELERRMDQNQALTYAMLAELINSLSSKQRKKMNRRIDNYIEDFRALALAKTNSAN
ncbi:hypothetical protein SAMN02745866_03493 [Alteromonadaceae bacterium Bs31]|nr:hypothetical protein SAMN02745866_03493 [Alteromonadaceae bacterium Bs31]